MRGFGNLQDFAHDLESAGELTRIREPVDPILELAARAVAEMRKDCPQGSAGAPWHDPANGHYGGKALLFENVKGSDIPVLINAFGSYHRMYRALGVDSYDDIANRIGELIKPDVPTGLMNKLKKGLEFAKLASYPPKVGSRGICQEVVHRGDEADVTSLPTIQCWPLDGQAGTHGKPADVADGTGRYITMAGIYTKHAETGERNVGMYRVQVHGPRTLAMHWHMHHDGARHFASHKKAGRKMPIAIVLGGESVLPFGATAPLPPGISELLFAGLLRDGSIPLVPCVSQPEIEVPANAEIVIEGEIDPAAEPIWEGPFGDHTGFYSWADRYPKMTVTAITHRRSPMFLATVVGKPPMEDYFLGKATERIFLPLLKTVVHDVIDYDLPMFGVFHNCAFIKIAKSYPHQARKVMHAIWGTGQMAFTKTIVVVDEHVDVHDPNAVWFEVCANVDPSRELEIVRGPVDILDHASVGYGFGGKWGIDATAKWVEEGVGGDVREWPTALE